MEEMEDCFEEMFFENHFSYEATDEENLLIALGFLFEQYKSMEDFVSDFISGVCCDEVDAISRMRALNITYKYVVQWLKSTGQYFDGGINEIIKTSSSAEEFISSVEKL